MPITTCIFDAYGTLLDVTAAARGAGLTTAILSNGSPDMLTGAVRSAGLDALLDDVLSVESVGIFKPADAVYQRVPDRFHCAPDEVLFVSSNGWDAAGATRFGFTTAWVNRMNLPMDRLGHEPAHVLTDLSPIPDIVKGTP